MAGLEFVIAFAFELQETEAVTEGIVQQREAAVSVLARRCLENGARSERSRNGCVEVSDDEVQMKGRPMSSVAAKLRSPFEGLAARGFAQQIDWRLCAQQFDESVEAPTDVQRKRLGIESGGAFDVIHVQIE